MAIFLAAALMDMGYQVTGVDRDAEAVKAATERGVLAVHADVHDIPGEYDVVMFTRSLHHAPTGVTKMINIVAAAGSCRAEAGGCALLCPGSMDASTRASGTLISTTRRER